MRPDNDDPRGGGDSAPLGDLIHDSIPLLASGVRGAGKVPPPLDIPGREALPPDFDFSRSTVFIGPAGGGKTRAAQATTNILNQAVFLLSTKGPSWRPQPTCTATPQDGMLPLLRVVSDLIRSRYLLLKDAPAAKASVTLQPVALVIEEAAAVFRWSGSAAEIAVLPILKQGPQAGVLTYITAQDAWEIPESLRPHLQVVLSTYPDGPRLGMWGEAL